MRRAFSVWLLWLLLAAARPEHGYTAVDDGHDPRVKVEPARIVLHQNAENTVTSQISIRNTGSETVTVQAEYDDAKFMLSPRSFKLVPQACQSVQVMVYDVHRVWQEEGRQVAFRINSGDEFLTVPVQKTMPPVQALQVPAASEPADSLDLMLQKQIRSMELMLAEKDSVILELRAIVARQKVLIDQLKARQNVDAADALKGLLSRLQSDLTNEMRRGCVSMTLEADGLMVRISGAAIFSSGSLRPQPAAVIMIEKIATAIHEAAGRICVLHVRGHADSQPLSSRLRERILSNWHLSAARAASVAELLHKRTGLPDGNIHATGFSFHLPLNSNESITGRTQNRRVEILIIPCQ